MLQSNRHPLRRVFVVLAIAWALLVLAGCSRQNTSGESASITADASDAEALVAEWEGRTGEAWDEFVSGYDSGWDSGCEDVTNVGLNSALYYEETEYTTADCALPDASSADVPVDPPDDPATTGEDLGYRDGCESIFDAAGEETLFDGTTYVTRSDCESNPVTSSEKVAGRADIPAPAPMVEPPGAVEDCEGFNLSGETNGGGAGWYDISVRNMSCTAVRQILLTDTSPNSQETARVTGYLCAKLGEAGETATFRCTAGETAFRYSFGA